MAKQCMVARSRVAALALTLLAGCATSSTGSVESAPPASLAGSSWRLAELPSSDDAVGIVHSVDPARYEMTLGTDGTVAMRLDCNRGSGHWTSAAANETQGTITFTPPTLTRAPCSPGSLDTRVARELGYVRTYLINGDLLTLIMRADGGTQVWMRAPN